jgi:hypothetical protein
MASSPGARVAAAVRSQSARPFWRAIQASSNGCRAGRASVTAVRGVCGFAARAARVAARLR